MTTRTFFLVLSPLLLLAAAVGFVAADARARPPEPTIYWSDEVVESMRSLVQETYVDEVDEAQARRLFFAACKAYMAGLDPYCEFYTPEELRSLQQETQGQFGGVGILGTTTREGILVQGARLEDPAWLAGIRAGDLIVAVDGVEWSVETGGAMLPRLRGEPGSSVSVAWIARTDGERRTATVTRSGIKIDSILGVELIDAEAGIGYVRIARFQDNTAEDLTGAIDRLEAEGARAIILDLRGDLGGVLPGAVACADRFLDEGVIVVTKGRAGIKKPPHSADADPDDELDAPLVVLVDGMTASAAEILAGALQDHRRAVLVGERTYGKFLVQRIVPLPEFGVAVRLTTARYYTPFGRNLQRDESRGVRGGLIPDVPVEVGDQEREQVRRWLDAQIGLDWDLLPERATLMGRPEDGVLQRALGLLRDTLAVEDE